MLFKKRRLIFKIWNLIIKSVLKEFLIFHMGLNKIQTDGQFTPRWYILLINSGQLTPNLGQIDQRETFL